MAVEAPPLPTGDSGSPGSSLLESRRRQVLQSTAGLDPLPKMGLAPLVDGTVSRSCSFVELLAQAFICFLEIENHVDPGQVQTRFQELADYPEAFKVVLTVKPGAALAAGRSDESSSLVEAQILGRVANQVGGHRNAIDPPGPVGLRVSDHQNSPFVSLDSFSVLHKIYISHKR